MTKNENKTKEVYLGLELNHLNLSFSANSRAVSAFDRFLGGLVGIPASLLERLEHYIQGKEKTVLSVQQAIISTLENDIAQGREPAEIVKNLAIAQNLHSIINKLQVANYTLEDLRDRPSVERHTTYTPQQDQDNDEGIDPNWLSHFERYAELASSETIRRHWAKVLAGEIRHPRSFSLTTLRILAEIDQHIAELFNREVSNRTQNSAILMPSQDEMRGEKLYSLKLLEEVGLLQTTDIYGGTSREFAKVDQGTFIITEQSYALVVRTNENLDDDINFPVFGLTRAGREIAAILPAVDPIRVLEQVGEMVFSEVDHMSIHEITKFDATDRTFSYKITPFKVLKGDDK